MSPAENPTEDTEFVESGGIPMVRVTYPDPLFRPIPPFSIDVPDTWVLSEFPDALFVMGPSSDTNGHWSNVVVRHFRVVPASTLEGLARSTWAELLQSYPDAKIIDEQMIHDHHLHYIREAELTMDGADELVARFDTLTFGPTLGHPTVDLFQITWTHPKAARLPRKQLYLDMLRSFRFIE